MWPPPEWLLWSWTAVAGAWWAIALRLVARASRPFCPEERHGRDARGTVSIFKPIPTLHDESLFAAVESFVRELDERAELLLGVEEQDAGRWESFRRERVKLICGPRPAQFLSPKVSWFHTLAPHATGAIWFWSDADMVLPAGGLAALRQEFAASGCALLTTPYVVRRARSAAVLEALFVNAEFYPGVLAAAGQMNFAMGAGMMFRADDFRRRANWEALGGRLADDHLLGQTLTPVRVSELTLETLPASRGWGEAIRHYLRWHKTVRWCRPGGYAAQLMILPVIGWAVTGGWIGLLATMQMEVLAAWLLCRRVGCRTWNLPALEMWAALRAVTWLACWLPWPVTFRSQRRKWYSLYRSEALNSE
jgi:ceramide glucosyltransferase